METLNQITIKIYELQQHLDEVKREFEFAQRRALAHGDRSTLRERMLYAGACLRMEELNEEREQTEHELEAWMKAGESM